MQLIIIISSIIILLSSKSLCSENIEVTTPLSQALTTSKPKTEDNVILNAMESYLTETKKPDPPQTQTQLQTGYMYPIYPAGYFYPGVSNAPISQEVKSYNYFSTVLPAAQAALQAGLKLFAKLGLFLMGGAGLLVLGGIFTTLMCYLTPICTISFAGYDFNKALDKETMRSLMTPEKIASAAALVQDAIGKYQRLQREVGQ